MDPTQLLIVLTAICLCALFAHHLRVAPPIIFLVGGVALALMPNPPVLEIDPEYMLLIFLPPILMEAALFTSLRDFRENLQQILLLAIGLVLMTSIFIAATTVAILPGATWALGFVLGAIVSPPDAAAATAALRNVIIPKRIKSILEGESLVNDATGIVVYKFAVAAVLVGGFSVADASLMFLWKAFGGLIIGLLVAFAFIRSFRYLVDPSVEILATFLPPYAAYIIAESFDMSGVLGVVGAGLMIGWHAPHLFTPRMRLSAEAIWHMMVFLLNSLAFLLIGLQLPDLAARLDLLHHPEYFAMAFVICIASVAVRFLWVFWMAYGLRRFMPSHLRKNYYPAWQNIFVVGWTGMRGVVTLALALALPMTLPDGTPFPYRDLIIFLSTSVIIFTLTVQGLSLPWLTRTLSLSFEPKRMKEEWHARVIGAKQALERLQEFEEMENVHQPALVRIREHYMERLESLGDGPNTPLSPAHSPRLMSHPLIQAENRLWAEAIRREREVVIALRRNYTIGDDVMNDILRELDLLASRFHYEEELLPESMTHAQLTLEQKQSLWYHPRLRKLLGM